jgi:hypothetical protein
VGAVVVREAGGEEKLEYEMGVGVNEDVDVVARVDAVGVHVSVIGVEVVVVGEVNVVGVEVAVLGVEDTVVGAEVTIVSADEGMTDEVERSEEVAAIC